MIGIDNHMPVSSSEVRLERDSLGTVEVPATALFGAHTVRGLANFSVSGVTMMDQPEFIRALAQVKAAAAIANGKCGVLGPERVDAILTAAREVAANRHDEHFPLEIVVGGGGTALNMNVNEVIANRANDLMGGDRGRYEYVHPNDHVNRSQSTNDVIPTALALAAVAVTQRVCRDLLGLESVLREKAEQASGLRRVGRTCLQDAVTLSVADTHASQAHTIARTAAALAAAAESLLAVPLSGTAIGSGIGTPDCFQAEAIEALRQESGLAVRPAGNRFDAIANIDGYVAVSAALVAVSIAMAKIAADLRLLSSGPVAGMGEVTLPAVQVGSSIMPGKVNPVIPELVMQVSYEVRGAATTIEAAAAGGDLELHAMLPVVARHLLTNLKAVGRVAQLFGDRCIAGLVWNEAKLAAGVAGALDAAVQRATSIGYSQVVMPSSGDGTG